MQWVLKQSVTATNKSLWCQITTWNFLSHTFLFTRLQRNLILSLLSYFLKCCPFNIYFLLLFFLLFSCMTLVFRLNRPTLYQPALLLMTIVKTKSCFHLVAAEVAVTANGAPLAACVKPDSQGRSAKEVRNLLFFLFIVKYCAFLDTWSVKLCNPGALLCWCGKITSHYIKSFSRTARSPAEICNAFPIWQLN